MVLIINRLINCQVFEMLNVILKLINAILKSVASLGALLITIYSCSSKKKYSDMGFARARLNHKENIHN